MSKQTWAEIVSSKGVNNTVFTEVIKQEPGKISNSEEFQEVLPTDIYVPEPPSSSNKEVQDNKLSESSIYKNEIIGIQNSIDTLERDIQCKKDKFINSYAYTKFNQDMETLYKQKQLLEQNKVKMERVLLLTTGLHAKRALEVIKRVKDYLGAKDEYMRKYTTFNNELRIYCNIFLDSKSEFFSKDQIGIEWEIKESIEKIYYWPYTVQLKFTVQSSQMIPVLEAAIKTEIGDCIIVNK